MQDYNEAADSSWQVLEIGYLFQKAYWHRGYAVEAAITCKEYAFDRAFPHDKQPGAWYYQ